MLYSGIIPVRQSDPSHPSIQVHVFGREHSLLVPQGVPQTATEGVQVIITKTNEKLMHLRRHFAPLYPEQQSSWE